ncbi:Helix-turn-helix domain-containing protein [Alicyclobacillus hesperidum]|uniref:Helix-turn-helix domain-containing protein n=1 Tax=Alicyclobacillus hesperidum TaxID=89784 RepID=A0A1H2YIR5_9BACL|nr:Helix-turn-helix domain-containing protein [Alicyclobacillus hesperidum]
MPWKDGENNNDKIEAIWGNKLLDEGFLGIPNIIVRNYRHIGIEHGEFGFICTVLTYKHDTSDPFPSQEKLAEHMKCSVRQIQKWTDSLCEKGLLLVGQRKHHDRKTWSTNVYNFRPLVEKALALVGETEPIGVREYDVVYRKPHELEVHTKPSELEVRMEPDVPEVQMEHEPEVRTNRSFKRLEDDDEEDEDRACARAFHIEENERGVTADLLDMPANIAVTSDAQVDIYDTLLPTVTSPSAWTSEYDPYLAIDQRMTMHLGRPYIAKENDYRAIKQLLESGVPMEFILAGIDYTFATFADRRPRSFAYCAEVIKDRWACELAKRTPVEVVNWAEYREDCAAPQVSQPSQRPSRSRTSQPSRKAPIRDERYEAFYALFPDG